MDRVQTVCGHISLSKGRLSGFLKDELLLAVDEALDEAVKSQKPRIEDAISAELKKALAPDSQYASLFHCMLRGRKPPLLREEASPDYFCLEDVLALMKALGQDINSQDGLGRTAPHHLLEGMLASVSSEACSELCKKAQQLVPFVQRLCQSGWNPRIPSTGGSPHWHRSAVHLMRNAFNALRAKAEEVGHVREGARELLDALRESMLLCGVAPPPEPRSPEELKALRDAAAAGTPPAGSRTLTDADVDAALAAVWTIGKKHGGRPMLHVACDDSYVEWLCDIKFFFEGDERKADLLRHLLALRRVRLTPEEHVKPVRGWNVGDVRPAKRVKEEVTVKEEQVVVKQEQVVVKQEQVVVKREHEQARVERAAAAVASIAPVTPAQRRGMKREHE